MDILKYININSLNNILDTDYHKNQIDIIENNKPNSIINYKLDKLVYKIIKTFKILYFDDLTF